LTAIAQAMPQQNGAFALYAADATIPVETLFNCALLHQHLTAWTGREDDKITHLVFCCSESKLVQTRTRLSLVFCCSESKLVQTRTRTSLVFCCSESKLVQTRTRTSLVFCCSESKLV
jgi:hypothetical protein